jgi:hypothetical protein
MSRQNSDDQAEEFLNKKVKIIFEPLLTAMVADRIEKPVIF